MNRIVHLALKVEDLERTTEFYQKVFGFKEMNTAKVRDHTSRHLSDGMLDVALIKYDAGTESAESKAAGEGPCIHHFAVEVDDIKEATKQIKAYNCEIISDPGVIPVKFRAPGGTCASWCPKVVTRSPRPEKRKKPNQSDEGPQRRLLVGPRARRAGAYIIVTASRWEYLGQDGPGPGFFPLWYGIAMSACRSGLFFLP